MLPDNSMQRLLQSNDLILMEAAINERLRRSEGIRLHETLVNAPLIYDPVAKGQLARFYQGYIDIAAAANKPFLMCTPTWRANRLRVAESGVNPQINADAVRFMQQIRNAGENAAVTIKIGGMIACKHDCYRPQEALSAPQAEEFHGWQIAQLAQAGVDFLLAETLPGVEEAKGIARAMAKTGLPYLISFVISREGRVLDGSRLLEAVAQVDGASDAERPLGYMVNCAYPGFLRADDQPAELFDRLVGYQANASALDHCDLDGSDRLQAGDLQEWGQLMLDMNRRHGVKILGGCCGTSDEHLEYLVSEGGPGL